MLTFYIICTLCAMACLVGCYVYQREFDFFVYLAFLGCVIVAVIFGGITQLTLYLFG